MKVFETKRMFLSSPRKVFKAFEDPSLLTKWWGPDGFTTTAKSFEFKLNGKWEFVMHGPDGKNYPNEMVFQEIAAPNKIVLRHTVEPYFTLTITIKDAEGGAILNWRQEFDSEEVARNFAHIVKPANEQNLDKLQALLAGSGQA